VEWQISDALVDYQAAEQLMIQRAEAIRTGAASELVWLLQHPHIYTAGSSANLADLLEHQLPVFQSGRGGQLTYHGPGQRIVYVMLDLQKRRLDIRTFIDKLERWLQALCQELGVTTWQHPDRRGLWCRAAPHSQSPDQEAKIVAIGLRLKRGVSLHGAAINVAPDMLYYQGIVPCGLKDYAVTSFKDLGLSVPMEYVDSRLKSLFSCYFDE